MANPSTMRDALIAELLGDVDSLVKRVEELHETMPEAVKLAEGRIRKAGEDSAAVIEKAGVASSRDLERQGKELLRGVDSAAQQTKTAARAFNGAGRTLWAMLALGVLGGAIAGAVASGVILYFGVGV